MFSDLLSPRVSFWPLSFVWQDGDCTPRLETICKPYTGETQEETCTRKQKCCTVFRVSEKTQEGDKGSGIYRRSRNTRRCTSHRRTPRTFSERPQSWSVSLPGRLPVSLPSDFEGRVLELQLRENLVMKTGGFHDTFFSEDTSNLKTLTLNHLCKRDNVFVKVIGNQIPD